MAKLKNGKRCDLCGEWMRALKEHLFCDSCVPIIKKSQELWKPTGGCCGRA
jgi:hypothetical protein